MNKTDKTIIASAISYITLVLIPAIIIWPIDTIYELITGIQWQDAVIGSWGLLAYFIFWLSFPIALLLTFAIYYIKIKQKPSHAAMFCILSIVVFGYGKYAIMYS